MFRVIMGVWSHNWVQNIRFLILGPLFNWSVSSSKCLSEPSLNFQSPLLRPLSVFTLVSLWSFFFFLINLFILFIYFWLRWVFVAVRGLSLVAASAGCALLRCASFSWRWLLLLRSTGSSCVGFNSCGSQALERRLGSCGAQA